jgi:tetratricopeptide (TPR) repeat protein
VVYETQGLAEAALACYLKAIAVDANYLSAYSNLALLYEGKRDLEKAAYYWAKRAELGPGNDPWTEKARQRLQDIRLVLSEGFVQELREQEVVGLVKDVETKKACLGKDRKALARSYFEKAKEKFKLNDEVNAWKLAVDASQLDPENSEIREFIERVQLRILSH